jgi:hypothetical protein
MSSSSMSRRHIPYLSFHKQIVREICRPQKDDLLLLAKGLGMRRVRFRSPILTFRVDGIDSMRFIEDL